MNDTNGQRLVQYAPVLLFGVLLLTPFMAVSELSPWRGIRVFVVQAVAIGLLASTLINANWSVGSLKRFILIGPNVVVVLLLGWAALFLVVAPPSGERVGMALVGVLRLTCGAAVYFSALRLSRDLHHLRLVWRIWLGAAIAASAASLVGFLPTSKGYATAAFGDTQLFGAFLVGFVPAAVVFAASGQTRRQRVVAALSVVLVACALLTTGTRSSWLGASVAVFVVGLLGLCTHRQSLSGVCGAAWQPRRILLGTVGIVALIAVYLSVGNAGALVLGRAITLRTASTDSSLTERLETWATTVDMIRQRPLAGWGIGSFPLVFSEAYPIAGGDQQRFPVPSAAQVQAHGVGLSSMAHNEYLQLAAELGLVGLTLYIGMLAIFFYSGVRCLKRTPAGFQRALVLATMGAVVAQAVDAIANPAWRFRDVGILLWLMLGLGMAATQCGVTLENVSSRVRAVRRRVRPRRWHAAFVATPVALLLAVGIGRVGSRTVLAATGLPDMSAVADPNSPFGFTIIAKTGDTLAGEGSLTEIPSYVSINDVGSVAFVGSVPVVDSITGALELRGNVYVGTDDGFENVTVETNNSLVPSTPYRYYYGPVQINNDNAIVAALDRIASRSHPGLEPNESSVAVWYQKDGIGPWVRSANIASAPLREWRFAGVSISSGGGSDVARVPGLGRVAFAAHRFSDKATFLRTNATPSGLFASGLASRLIHLGDHPFFSIPLFPMITDAGRMVLKSGNVPPDFAVPASGGHIPGRLDSIRLYGLTGETYFFSHGDLLNLDGVPAEGRDYAPYRLTTFAGGDQNQFSSLGNMPGISDDGRIAVFAGTLKASGAEALNHEQEPFVRVTEGPGIFALIATRRGNKTTDKRGHTVNEGRMLVRVAGVGGNGLFDAGEVLADKNGNGVFDAELGEDDGPRFSAFQDRERVSVNNAGTVVFTAVDEEGRKGLYASRLNVYAVTASVDPPVLIARQEDTIIGLRGKLKDIRLYDPINNRGEGDIAFWVRMEDLTAADPADRDSQAIIRARPKGCERGPAVVPLPLQTGLEVSGYEWTLRARLSESDGLVVEDVHLGSRYMARKFSLPYLKLGVTRGDEELVPTERFELVPGRLVDFQQRTEADKVVIAGTFAIANIPSGSDNCLLLTQRYEFREYAADHDDVGAPGFRQQHPVSRFMPVAQYVFIGEQFRRIPHRPTHAKIELVQRLDFKPDFIDGDKSASAVTVFSDTGVGLAIPGDFRSWYIATVPLLANPLPREQKFRAINAGNAGDWDNFHQTIKPVVQRPIPIPLIGRPGCWECVHIHWRWGPPASFGFFSGNPSFGFGDPLIPVGSDQSVEVGVSRYHTFPADLQAKDEDPPEDFRTLFNLEPLNFYPETHLGAPLRLQPVMWYAGSSDREDDAFFTHGGHFSVPPAPEDDDTVSPTTGAIITPPANTAGWHNADVTVTLTSQDDSSGSGVGQITYSVAGAEVAPTTIVTGDVVTIPITVEGVSTVTFFATDQSGNVEALHTLPVALDKTPPTITGTRTPAPGSSGWNKTPVSVAFQCADSLSGLAPGSPPEPRVIAAEGANQSVNGVCSDVAGNTVQLAVGDINIDTSPPLMSVTVSPSMLWPANGKLALVEVTGSISDILSGIDLSTVAVRVVDEYGIVQPSGLVALFPGGGFSFTLRLEASRLGRDRDGRRYDVVVSGSDKSGNARSISAIVTVPHDQGK